MNYKSDTLPNTAIPDKPGSLRKPSLDKTTPTQTPSEQKTSNDLTDPLLVGGWETVVYGLVFALITAGIVFVTMFRRK